MRPQIVTIALRQANQNKIASIAKSATKDVFTCETTHATGVFFHSTDRARRCHALTPEKDDAGGIGRLVLLACSGAP